MRIAIVILILVGFYPAYAQLSLAHKFEFRGNVTGLDSGYIYLTYNIRDQKISDSSRITHGQFNFTGRIYGPTKALLYTKKQYGRHANSTIIFLEPSELTGSFIAGDFDNGLIRGSETQKQLSELNVGKLQVRRKYSKLIDSIYSAKNDTLRTLLRSRLTPYFSAIRALDLK
ncbi:MAG: DUF4369 domain-containing protein, partial [Bacteroidetes bacterium]|nr:DUF4369 domain-containing protein [Bacteroidota bacterium]